MVEVKFPVIGGAVLIGTLIVASVSLYKGAAPWRRSNESKYVERILTGTTLWKGSNVCKTAECISTAKRIKRNMDPKVNPCDDFYRFACGNYLKTAKIDDDRTKKNSFTDLTDTLNNQLKELIYEKSQSEAQPFYYLKRLFQLCLDEEAIEKRGTGHVLELLKKAGEWPLLGSWQEKNWNWFKTELQLSEMNMDDGSMFALSVMEDIGHNHRRVIWIDQSGLLLPREYLIKGAADPVLQALLKYMVDVAVELGAKRDDRLQKSLSQVLDFQIKLATIHTPQEQRRDLHRMYNLKTLNEIMEDDRLNWIDWRKYFNTVMSKSVTLKDDELFIIPELDYFEKLEVLIRDSHKEVIANYMFFMAVHMKVPYLPKTLRDLQFDLRKKVLGMKTEIPRWEVCLGMASSLDLALSSLYIAKFFDNSRKEAVSDMMRRIRKELLQNFKGLDWMDASTREKAESKASLAYELIGYPKELTNVTKLEEHYSELKLNTEHLFEAQLDLTGWITQYALKLLRKPVDKKDWQQFGNIAMANAYYSPIINALIFPAGILQPPFFGSEVPSYVNYASIGFIMGHELTHGFDDQGSQFNGNGDLEQWWGQTSIDKFKEKTQCVVEQYAAFKEPLTQLNLNGINTQGENIADIGGLKMAFRAYRHQASQLTEPEPMLPGLKKYTREQLFMITLANVWCSVSRPETMKIAVLTNRHPPSEFRVNGMLMNLKEFGDLFKCAPGTPMNPHDKCNVW